MVKPPKIIRLAGGDWKLIPDPDLGLIGEADGMTILSRHEVRYNPSLGGARLRQVIAHEVEHLIWGVAEVNTSLVAVNAIEELVASITATLRVELLRNNPRLVEFLAGD